MDIGIERPVDELGRIVIPKEFRKFYNINEHDKIYISATEDGLLVRKRNYKVVEIKDTEM